MGEPRSLPRRDSTVSATIVAALTKLRARSHRKFGQPCVSRYVAVQRTNDNGHKRMHSCKSRNHAPSGGDGPSEKRTTCEGCDAMHYPTPTAQRALVPCPRTDGDPNVLERLLKLLNQPRLRLAAQPLILQPVLPSKPRQHQSQSCCKHPHA